MSARWISYSAIITRTFSLYVFADSAFFALNISVTQMPDFTIKPDDLTSPEIAVLLADHLREMQQHSPPESVHALDLEKLKRPEITFWSIWTDDELVGCGALKELHATHAEIKSMLTNLKYQGMGAGKLMLRHILDEAKKRLRTTHGRCRGLSVRGRSTRSRTCREASFSRSPSPS